MIQEFFDISPKMIQLDQEVMDEVAPYLANLEEIKQYNQLRMLKAFTGCRVGLHHLVGTTGYGYDDAGREKLEEVFAALTGSEAALFRHNFMSGTHTLAVALFGLLRPGDTLLCGTGRPYDTLHGVLGIGENPPSGSLADFGVQYQELPLANGVIDLDGIRRQAAGCKLLYLQRSRGYADRKAFSPHELGQAARAAREGNPGIWVMVDNCYGEFMDTCEPTQAGVDLIAGSLIKNPGGGIAPTGGYIAGRQQLVDLCAGRFSAPGVGDEVGSTNEMLRQMYLGLYFAPGVSAEAAKTSVYASALFRRLGYQTSPGPDQPRNDIITAITLGDPEKLKALCGAIQSCSPVDSYVTPEPSPMPGYDSQVIMAAGAFTQGSSIELSCDAPMRLPYTAYLQGGLNFMASRAAVLLGASAIGSAE